MTGDPAADGLLNDDPFALVVGMLLDQQVPIEVAFAAPAKLADRLGERFSPAGVAAMAEDELVAACCARPAVHRYPAAMAGRIGALARALVEDHGGRADAVWADVGDGEELRRRLLALPGFGDEKARIFVALLAKRFAVRPSGWEAASAPFSDDQPRSAADVGSRADFERVKAWKRAMRSRGLAKVDPV
ncbi:MAG: Fe-S cluster assembly protein HesB [Acidimicrobiia bacterium]|nr:Fe-S cluster assembly protein HesB [Acidimicrobiia bacterium]